MADVTQLLRAIDSGDPRAINQLLPLVYDELRRMAAAHMKGEKPGHTLDATALVHEAWLRLVGSDGASAPPHRGYSGRRHFFAAAAEAMRHILVDSARRRQAQKRGSGQVQHDLDGLDIPMPEPREDLVAVDDSCCSFSCGGATRPILPFDCPAPGGKGVPRRAAVGEPRA